MTEDIMKMESTDYDYAESPDTRPINIIRFAHTYRFPVTLKVAPAVGAKIDDSDIETLTGFIDHIWNEDSFIWKALPESGGSEEEVQFWRVMTAEPYYEHIPVLEHPAFLSPIDSEESTGRLVCVLASIGDGSSCS